MTDIKKPHYQEEKAIAVAAKLLRLSGGNCDKYWLNKLMYYLERQSLVQSGQPIYFGDLYSAPLGPIVSSVTNGIDSTAAQTKTKWANIFSLEGHTVSLKHEPDYSSLSEFEEGLIDDAFQQFRGWDFNRLSKYFHSLPEYHKTESREEISYEEILIAEGYAPKDIQTTLDEISYLGFLENSLHCAP